MLASPQDTRRSEGTAKDIAEIYDAEQSKVWVPTVSCAYGTKVVRSWYTQLKFVAVRLSQRSGALTWSIDATTCIPGMAASSPRIVCTSADLRAAGETRLLPELMPRSCHQSLSVSAASDRKCCWLPCVIRVGAWCSLIIAKQKFLSQDEVTVTKTQQISFTCNEMTSDDLLSHSLCSG